MIDPHEEAAAEIAALPPQPQSFTPGFAHGQDWVDASRYAVWSANLMKDMAANLGIPAEVVRGSTNFASAHSIARDHFEYRVMNPLKAYAEAMLQRAVANLQFKACYKRACLRYRDLIGRLPGSERTARLRKKRMTRVLNWYFNVHLPAERKRMFEVRA